jgi:hypothetical protein
MIFKTDKFSLQFIFSKLIPLAIGASGIFLWLMYAIMDKSSGLSLTPVFFTETIKIPLDYISIGDLKFPIEVDNLLIFQFFDSIPHQPIISLNYSFYYVFLILFSFVLISISYLKNIPFFIGTAIACFIISLSGFQDLNIGGVASYWPLGIVFLVTLLPLYLFRYHISSMNWSLKWLIQSLALVLTLWILKDNSQEYSSGLLLSENFLLPGVLLSGCFLIYVGHSFIAGITHFLLKINQNVGVKITYHITIVFILWLIFNIIQLLNFIGETKVNFFNVPAYYFMLLVGIMGYFVHQSMTNQKEIGSIPKTILNSFYLVLFGLTIWTWGKVELNTVQSYLSFLTHLFYYGQIAVGTVFYVYLMANFFNIMNSGKPVHLVLFKPQFFSFFHLRIGAVMALTILVIYNNGIIVTQLQSGIIHATGDYYYEIGNTTRAGIFYENAWMQYKQNHKAKNSLIHILLEQNQPSLALNHLEESFEMAPNVPNIILISKILLDKNQPIEALYYLERGLYYFPNDNYLLNNIAIVQARLNQSENASMTLQQMNGLNDIKSANQLAIHLKFEMPEIKDLNIVQNNNIGLINLLAKENLNGNIYDLKLDFNKISGQENILAAAVLNQWSNHSFFSYDEDIAFIDQLISNTPNSFSNQTLHEAKVIRSYQQGHLNQSLKDINGTASVFSNSAGYYLQLAAHFYWKNLDLEKGGKDYLLAVEKGFQNIQPQHLALLYFGGYPLEAVLLHKKFNVEFPSFMNWDSDGKLISNDQIVLLSTLGKLYESNIEDLFLQLQGILDPRIKSELLLNILIHKGHWLSAQEIEMKFKETNFSNFYPSSVKDWKNLLIDQNFDRVNESIKKTLKMDQNTSWDVNAYHTPLVLQSFHLEKDQIKKYEILQDAIQFNKDPILLLNYVQQSEKIGLSNYGEGVMNELRTRLSESEIEILLKKYFWGNNS